MKKLVSLIIVICLSLCGCGKSDSILNDNVSFEENRTKETDSDISKLENTKENENNTNKEDTEKIIKDMLSNPFAKHDYNTVYFDSNATIVWNDGTEEDLYLTVNNTTWCTGNIHNTYSRYSNSMNEDKYNGNQVSYCAYLDEKEKPKLFVTNMKEDKKDDWEYEELDINKDDFIVTNDLGKLNISKLQDVTYETDVYDSIKGVCTFKDIPVIAKAGNEFTSILNGLKLNPITCNISDMPLNFEANYSSSDNKLVCIQFTNVFDEGYEIDGVKIKEIRLSAFYDISYGENSIQEIPAGAK